MSNFADFVPLYGGAAPSPSWLPNAADAGANITVSGYTLTSTSGTSNRAARGTSSQSSGLWMWSFWPSPAGPNWVIGNEFVGLANASQSLSTYLGSSGNSVGLRTSGVPIFNNVNLSTVGAYQVGSRVDIAYDFTNTKIYFRTDMGFWNGASGTDPATNTGGISVSGLTGALYPAISFNNDLVVCSAQAIPFAASGISINRA